MKREKVSRVEDIPEETRVLLEDYEAYLRGVKAPSTVYRRGRELVKFFTGLIALGREHEPGRITSDEIEAYLAYRMERKLSSTTYNGMVEAITSFFDYLLERELVYRNPAQYFPLMSQRSEETLGVYTEDEVKRILVAIPALPGSRRRGNPPLETTIGRCSGRGTRTEEAFLNLRDRAVIELLYSTGMRRSECAGLDIEDVDLHRGEILIRCGKGGKERIVPVGEKALRPLMAYLDERVKILPHEEALFVSQRMKRITPEIVADRIRVWKENARVTSPGCTHAFRHSFASHLLAHGAPLEAIRRLLGHAQIGTTTRYTHLREENVKAVYEESHPCSRRRATERYEYHGIRIRRRKGS